MTEYQAHCARWEGGCGSDFCKLENTQRVLARGTIPCDVLFIGEAPGESENHLKVPFVGPAGKLLDQIIEQVQWQVEMVSDGSVEGSRRPWTYAITNLVSCIPRMDGGGYDDPTDEQVVSCQPRLREFIQIARPALIVTVGKIATDWLDQGYKHALKLVPVIPQVSVDHPARILRASQQHKGIMVQRCVVVISQAIRQVFGIRE